MDLKIVIDISLTQEELEFLRRYFENRERSLNLHFIELKKETAINLVQKEILKIDSISNMLLTNVGRKVMDMIDRDNRINEILN
jgi:hypothetical protein